MLKLPAMEADLNKNCAGWRPDALKRLEGAVEEDVHRLDDLRGYAVSPGAKHESAIQNLLDYAQHLSNVTNRLEGFEAELKLEFFWCSAFNSTKKLVSGSVYFEYASILWNLASRYSLMGVSEDRKSPEGLKTAAKYLQFAAGIIAYTKDKIAPKIKGALFSNMTENALNFALYLMLAQAQACFYLKAVADRDSGSTAVTPSIIAKIASQSSLFYKRALELSRQPPLDTSLDDSWHQVLQLSSKNFEGYAELYQSIAAKAIALKTGSGYGEEIARLRKSQRLLSEVINAVSKLGPSLAAIGDEPKRTLPKIASALSVAEKDNSVVYLDRVPDEGGLSPVGAVVMVKAVDPLGSLPTPSKPLFQNVLSRGASFILAAYKSRVQELLSLITAESNQGTNQANSILSDVGLPGSLDAYKTQGKLPENLWSKVENIQRAGGLAEIERRMRDVDLKASRASSSLESLSEAMEHERKTEAAFRSRNPDWSGPSSSVAMHELNSQLVSLRDAYASARMMDAKLSDSLRRGDIDMSILSQSRSDVAQLLPAAKEAGGVDTRALESALRDLNTLIADRDRLLCEFKKDAEADQTSVILERLASGDSAVQVQADLLSSLEKLGDGIRETLATQSKLLDAVLSANQSFVERRVSSPQAMELDRVISRIEKSISRYTSVTSQLQEGLVFYSNLQARLSSLSQNLDDLCYSQLMLRQEHESQIALQFSRQTQEQRDMELAKRMQEDIRLLDTSTIHADQHAPQKPQHPGSKFSNASSVQYPSFLATPPMQTQQYTYQHTAPMASPVPGVTTASYSEGELSAESVSRLIEMGFQRNDVTRELQKANGDERTALNALLGL